MAPKVNLVNVNVSVNGKEQTIKMEKGTSFENKGGIFTAGETNGEYKNGGFVADMSEFLPEGYKIEKESTQNSEKVVQAQDLHKVPNKRMGIEKGYLVYEGADVPGSSRLPYVENGDVKLVYADSDIHCSYKDGKLVKYAREVRREVDKQFTYMTGTSSKGDYQRAEFYPNGRVKSLDIKYIEYGEYEGAQFKCEYDKNGNYISGKHRVYNTDTQQFSWEAMNQEDANFYTDIYLLFY